MISIILGLGLAMIFRRSCKNRSCIIYKIPDPNEIKSKVFRFNNKCVKMKPTAVFCPADMKKKVYIQ